MTYEQFESMFGETLSLQGVESFFADELSDLSFSQPDKHEDLVRLFLAPCKDAPGELNGPQLTFSEHLCHELKGSWLNILSGHHLSCKLFLHDGDLLPVRAICDCGETDAGFCRHTAALAVAYLVNEQGQDVFVGTRLGEKLKEITGLEDPFQPGILKRTDERLTALLPKKETQTSLPVFVKNAVTSVSKPLSAEWILSDYKSNVLYLECRIGAERHYVVKDIRLLLDTYAEGGEMTFGKSTLRVAPEVCLPETRKVMELLTTMVAETLNGKASKLFTGLSATSMPRFMVLRGNHIDRVLEALDGQSICISDIDGTKVELGRKALKLTLKKKAYGATLFPERVRLVVSTALWHYCVLDGVLFRVPKRNREGTDILSEMNAWNEPVYIRESDLPSVYRNIVSYFNENGSVEQKGLSEEVYVKEIPEFRFDLDLEEDCLFCSPFALYPLQGMEYALYEAKDAIRRNPEEERKAGDLLTEIFDEIDPVHGRLIARMDNDRLFDFMRTYLPALEQLGTVRATDAVLRRKVRQCPPAQTRLSVDGGGILFSLKATGFTPDEIAEILNTYDRKKRYHCLRSGAFIQMDEKSAGEWETLADLYSHYGDKNDPSMLHLPLYRALYLQEAIVSREERNVEMSEAYCQLLSRIGTAGAGVDAPQSLRDVLRPYQIEGYRWIRMLKDNGFGGILADDMGLGKTLQVLAFLLSEKESGKTGEDLRTLIVCPASLVYNWKKEIENFAPALTSRIISGPAAARREMIGMESDADIWITSYDLLKRDIALYENIHFANEVIDEAQYIKNQNAQASRSVRVVNSDFRLALTGTPIENHLGELWSIMDYLMPGFLYNYSAFQKEFEIPIVTKQSEESLNRLRRMVHPFILRRMKRQVLKDLPDKLEETVTVQLEEEQKKLYDASAEEIRQMLGRTGSQEFRKSKLEFLSRLTRLRQLCCDPSLLYENYDGGSAKLEACIQLIRQAVDSGHKLLLFSQFTSMLDIIGKRLESEGIAFHRLDGSTSKENRMRMVDSFANDDVPVFCISLKAGGTGLNLTAADIVIHFDPWWNQAAQDQATDRTHRIGQTQTVNVYELIAAGTIEERIMKIKESKSALAGDVLSGESISSTMIDKEDLLALLD